MNEEFCDPNCPYLDPKEEDQTDAKEVHRCTKYKCKLYHFRAHPNIHKLKICTE